MTASPSPSTSVQAAGTSEPLARVFISYSRRDRAFADRLDAALKQRGISVWIDRESIPISADWMASIRAAIEEAESVVLLLTPASAQSDVCGQELAYALELNKRIIPVLHEDVDPSAVAPAISRLNWLFLREVDDFATGIQSLIKAITTDLVWVQVHTRLLERASEWERRGRRGSELLRGSDLREAEDWLAAAAGKDPAPTALHSAYIVASRRSQAKRQRIMVALLAGGLIAALALSIFAIIQRQQAQREQAIATSRELAADATSVLPTDPELSILLAGQAFASHQTTEAEDALRAGVATSTIRAALTVPGALVYTTMFSPDGRYVLTTDSDRAVRVWDWQRRHVVARLQVAATTAHFSPDGRYVAVAGTDSRVQVWDWRSHRLIAGLAPTGNAVTDAAFSRSGQEIAVAEGPLTRIWRWRSLRTIAVLNSETSNVESAVFAPRDRFMVTPTAEGTAEVWSLRTAAAPLAVLKGPRDILLNADITTDGRYVAGASADGTTTIWDVRSQRRLRVISDHTGHVFTVAFAPHGPYMVTTSADRLARIWNWRTSRLIRVLRAEGGQLTDAAFSGDGQYVVTAGTDGVARIWQWRALTPAQLLAPRTGTVDGMAFSRDGRYLAVAGSSGVESVWDWDSGREVVHWRGEAQTLGPDAFSGDSRHIAGPLQFGSVRIWDWHTGRTVATASSTDAATAAFGPRGSLVVAAGRDGSASVWNWRTGRLVTLAGSGAPLTYASISPDGRLVLTSTAASTPAGKLVVPAARVWDWRTRRVIAVLRGHGDALTAAAFSHDGRYIVTSSADDTARVWDAATGRSLSSLVGHEGAVTTAAFSRNDALVLTASADGTARLWDWQTGRTLFRLSGIGAQITGASFAADGTHITLSLSDGTVGIYTCEACRPTAGVLRLTQRRVTRGLTPDERQLYLHEAPKTPPAVAVGLNPRLGAALCAGAIARVSYVRGGVLLEGQGQAPTAGSVGTCVFPDERIKTGPNQRATIRFRDGTRLNVSENTELEFISPTITKIRAGEVAQFLAPGTNHRVLTPVAEASAIG